MIEKETEIVEREVETVTAYVCDICGKRYDDVFEMQEFFNLRWTGGYGSVFGDTFKYEVDICQYCANKLWGKLARCVHDPNEAYMEKLL